MFFRFSDDNEIGKQSGTGVPERRNHVEFAHGLQGAVFINVFHDVCNLLIVKERQLLQVLFRGRIDVERVACQAAQQLIIHRLRRLAPFGRHEFLVAIFPALLLLCAGVGRNQQPYHNGNTAYAPFHGIHLCVHRYCFCRQTYEKSREVPNKVVEKLRFSIVNSLRKPTPKSPPPTPSEGGGD